MGFMDKAREAALKATAQAQQVAQQGQAKMQAAQQNKSEAQLLQALGQAVYAVHRSGGDPAAVDAALAALDSHYAGAAAPPAAGPPVPGDGSAAAPPAAPAPAAPAAPGAPSGEFTLDDL